MNDDFDLEELENSKYYQAKKDKIKVTKTSLKEAIIGSCGIINVVASRLKVENSLVKKYLDRYPDLQQLMIEESKLVQDLAENLIYKSIKSGDVNTAKWFLEHKSKDGFRTDVQKVQISFVDDIK